MFNLIRRTVNYSLHSLIGFNIEKVPLKPFCIQEPSLTLISELYTTSEPVLALSMKGKDTVNGSEKNNAIAHDVESLLLRNNYTIKINPIKIHTIDESINEIITGNQLNVLNNKYVFLENLENAIHGDLYGLVFTLQLKNLIPVICFPEKNLHFTSNSQRLLRLKDRGCVFHIDLLSLTGHCGQEAKKVSTSLLKSNQVNFVSFKIADLDKISKNNSIQIPKRVADLLDEQLFIG